MIKKENIALYFKHTDALEIDTEIGYISDGTKNVRQQLTKELKKNMVVELRPDNSKALLAKSLKAS